MRPNAANNTNALTQNVQGKSMFFIIQFKFADISEIKYVQPRHDAFQNFCSADFTKF